MLKEEAREEGWMKELTLAFAKLPMPRYTLLSRR